MNIFLTLSVRSCENVIVGQVKVPIGLDWATFDENMHREKRCIFYMKRSVLLQSAESLAFLSRPSRSHSQEGGILSSDSWSVFRGFSFPVFLAILWGQNQGKAVTGGPLISHSHLLSPWQRQRCDRLLHKQGNPFDKTASAVYPCARLFVKVLLFSLTTRMHKHIMELSLLHPFRTQGNLLWVSEALTDRKTELCVRNFFFFLKGLWGKELENV